MPTKAQEIELDALSVEYAEVRKEYHRKGEKLSEAPPGKERDVLFREYKHLKNKQKKLRKKINKKRRKLKIPFKKEETAKKKAAAEKKKARKAAEKKRKVAAEKAKKKKAPTKRGKKTKHDLDSVAEELKGLSRSKKMEKIGRYRNPVKKRLAKILIQQGRI